MGFVTFQSILVHHPAPPKIIGPTLYEPPHLQTPRGRRRICQAHSHCSAVFGSLESFSRLGFCICCNPCQKTYFQTPLRNILRKMETVKNKFMQTGSCQKIFCEKWKVSKIILWKMETVKISSLVSKHTQNNCQNLFYENWKLSKSKKNWCWHALKFKELEKTYFWQFQKMFDAKKRRGRKPEVQPTTTF